MKEEASGDNQLLTTKKKDHYDDDVSQDYLALNFPNNHDLIDLINDEDKTNKLAITTISTSFMTDRDVDIEKPQLIKDGYLTSYKLYRVKTKTKGTNEWQTTTLRRFNDF